MAFIGWLGKNDAVMLPNGAETTFDNLPADTYYVLTETGEIFDRQSEAEEACWNTHLEIDDDGEEVWVPDDEPYSMYAERKVEPFLLTRQRGCYRSYPSINISRRHDSIPPGMLCAGNGFDAITECATRAEALETAKSLAARWAALCGEPVEVECDSAEIGGDEATYTALPSGLIFEGSADDLIAC